MKRFALLLLLLARAVSAQQATTNVMLPMGVVNDGTQSFQTNLICYRGPFPVGITNLTEIAFFVTLTAPCGVAIYQDSDSGAQVVTTGALTCGAGVVTATGLGPVSLAPFTPYRLCICRKTATGAFASLNLTGPGYTVLNAFHSNNATAANSCDATTGAPPPTTGALTPSTTVNPPIVLVSTTAG